MSRRAARRSPLLLAGAALGATLAAVLAWGEWITRRGSRDTIRLARSAGADPDAPPRGVHAVIVLGFPPRADGTASAVQRWRVRIALRSADPRTARFVFTGAVTRGEISEAAAMAEYAILLGVDPMSIVLEEHARNTWENIVFSLPLVADAESITIASNTFHARRATRYLVQQAPELARRLRRARDYRLGELTLAKPLFAVYEIVRARRERGSADAG